MAQAPKLDDYVDVAARIVEFRAKYPDGRLRPVDPAKPYWVETLGSATFIVYAAAALRSETDANPGIGLAWEPFPGRTPYTRDSELMNAETGAWGRAIMAALAADAKKGIASREEVRNRREDAQGDAENTTGPSRASRPARARAEAEKPAGEPLDDGKLLKLIEDSTTGGQLNAVWKTIAGLGRLEAVPDGKTQCFKDLLYARSDELGIKKSADSPDPDSRLASGDQR